MPLGRVRWTVRDAKDGRSVRIRWQELGGPPVRQPERRGFGTTLLAAALPSRRIAYAAEGLAFEADLRLQIKLVLHDGSRLRRLRNRGPGARVQECTEHFAHPRSRSAGSDALHVHASAFEQKKNFVGEPLRIAISGLPAERGNVLALMGLVGLDDRPCRMAFLGNLDCGIGQRTAAVSAIRHVAPDALHPSVQLCQRVAWMGSRKLGPDGIGFLGEPAEILGDQQILGFKVPVEGHFVGLSSSGDFVDADRPDATRIEQRPRRREDALARRRSRRAAGNGGFARNFFP